MTSLFRPREGVYGRGRYLGWVGLCFGLAMLLAMASGCDCGKPPVIEGGTETTSEVTTDAADGTPTCTNLCDCPQGQDCQNGICVVPTIPVYCCDRENCPQGLACTDSSGSTASCGLRKACKHPCDCPQRNACVDGFCTASNTPTFCCEKAGCEPGKTCVSLRGGSKTCGGEGQPCVSACDCSGGLACTNGLCTKGPVSVFCCDDPQLCPKGEACESKRGAKGVCGQTEECKATCDCPTGQACLNGKCEASPVPVYCCETPEKCPSGQACDTRDGQRKTCEATPGCKSHCDCAQGLFCDKGQCAKGPTPVYCCEKPGCPASQACYKTDNSVDTCKSPPCVTGADCGKPSCAQQGTQCSQALPVCQNGVCGSEVKSGTATCDPSSGLCGGTPPPQCKTHCDCPQGLACDNNQCVKTNNGTFCCSKPGCPSGSSCFNTNGTPGSCPGNTGCKSNQDCPANSCQNAGGNCAATTNVCDLNSGKCVQKTSTLNNATCRTINGVGTCVPSQCKTGADCGKVSCRDSGTICIQQLPFCSNGSCSTRSTAVRNAKCNAATGSCTTAPPCLAHCDCAQGLTCQRDPATGASTCVKGPQPVYCCAKAGCPSKAACVDSVNRPGVCPIVCASACDCATGEDCVATKCVAGPTPVYCCDNPQQCPPGAACKSKAGVAGTCKAAPRPCKVACDCVQGEGCVNGQCAKTATPTYCCDSAGCASGQACTNKLGQTGTCPITCKTHCDCPQGRSCTNGFCNATVNGAYCCTKSGCPSNFGCFNTDGSRGRCPTTTCTSACDCNQGEDCRNGACVRVNPPVYCCSKTGCPSGQACKDTANKWGSCPAAPSCKSPCDCPQGRDCYNGTCIQVFPAVYCCSAVGCPAGQACYDSANKPSVCPGAQCTSACDCPNQGQACVRGRCTYTNPRVYCCSKPGCVSGNACEDANGSSSTCAGPKCTSACDCTQGEDCRNGQCVRVNPPVYCCTKTGCRAGQACVNSNGSSSSCPVQCSHTCDCQQGFVCSQGTCFPSNSLYCCDNPGCPSGSRCITRTNQQRTCGTTPPPTTCKARCDCSQGQECQAGKCVQTPNRVYCCDKAGCPRGFSCRDKTDKAGFCSTAP